MAVVFVDKSCVAHCIEKDVLEALPRLGLLWAAPDGFAKVPHRHRAPHLRCQHRCSRTTQYLCLCSVLQKCNQGGPILIKLGPNPLCDWCRTLSQNLHTQCEQSRDDSVVGASHSPSPVMHTLPLAPLFPPRHRPQEPHEEGPGHRQRGPSASSHVLAV